MAIQIEEKNLVCYAVDQDTAVMKLLNESYVLDYSTLMDLVMNLVGITAQMEKAMDPDKQSALSHLTRGQTYTI